MVSTGIDKSGWIMTAPKRWDHFPFLNIYIYADDMNLFFWSRSCGQSLRLKAPVRTTTRSYLRRRWTPSTTPPQVQHLLRQSSKTILSLVVSFCAAGTQKENTELTSIVQVLQCLIHQPNSCGILSTTAVKYCSKSLVQKFQQRPGKVLSG